MRKFHVCLILKSELLQVIIHSLLFPVTKSRNLEETEVSLDSEQDEEMDMIQKVIEENCSRELLLLQVVGVVL